MERLLEAISLSTAVDPEQREQLAGLRATLDLAPIGIAHFDTQGRFLLANQYLCRLLGRGRAELQRSTFQELTHPDDLESCLRHNDELVRGEVASYRQDKRFVRADGVAVWARVTVSAVRGRDGGVAFFVGVAEDITELKRADAEREHLFCLEREARAAAERAIRARDDVVALVAHDLRNPVHTIGLAAGVLQQPALREEQRETLVRTIARTTAGMERLLNDLLDASRMEAGTFAVAHAPLAPRDVLESVRELFEAKARDRGLVLRCDAAPGVGSVNGDRDRVVQVLSNLAANAVKFARPPGEVAVEVRGCPEGARFTVRDNGPGIPAEDQPHLFDRFWQRDPHAGGGAGLGLAIAKGIVEAHGGRIWVESDSAGSAFHFTLPTV